MGGQMSKMNILKLCVVVVWSLLGVLVLLGIIPPFSEKFVTFLVCVMFADNIVKAKWINIDKEKT
jgi:hypothetical protein